MNFMEMNLIPLTKNGELVSFNLYVINFEKRFYPSFPYGVPYLKY
jgi:hypothetical protein